MLYLLVTLMGQRWSKEEGKLTTKLTNNDGKIRLKLKFRLVRQILKFGQCDQSFILFLFTF